jgi:hypothetical protein
MFYVKYKIETYLLGFKYEFVVSDKKKMYSDSHSSMLIDVCGGGQLGFSIHKKNESSLGNIQCLCMYRLDSIKFPFLRTRGSQEPVSFTWL